MPLLAFSKSTFGAVVDVRLMPSVAQLRMLGNRAAKVNANSFKMLLDTGAEHSAVDETMVSASWGLYPTTFAISQTLNGRRAHVPIYELAVTIFDPNGNFAWEVDALQVSARAGSPFDETPYHGVIGRDFLDRGLLVYGGATSKCTIAY